MKKTLTNWMCLSGSLAAVFYFLHDLVGQRHYPGYNWLEQAVSDLTAVHAPSRVIAGGLSAAYGIFAVLGCAMMCILVQGKGNKTLRLGVYLYAAMNLVSAVGYGLFPLSDKGQAGTFQDIMHVYVVTVLVVLLSIVSLVLIAIGGLKNRKRHASLSVWAIIAFGCMLFGAVGANNVPDAYFGLVERFSTYSVVLFTAILGLYGFTFFDRRENLKSVYLQESAAS